MTDHEGKIKEISWDGIQPQLHIFNHPEDAPIELRTDQSDSSTCLCPNNDFSTLLTLAMLIAAFVATSTILYTYFFYRKPKIMKNPASRKIPKNSPLLVVDFAPISDDPDDTNVGNTSHPRAPAASPSSSVTQMEAMLRFCPNIKYTKTVGSFGPDVAPLAGRTGFLQHGNAGIHSTNNTPTLVQISDPWCAIRYLVANKFIPRHLELPTQPSLHSSAILVQRVCDTDLQAALLYFRYYDDENWKVNSKVLSRKEFKHLVWPLSSIMLCQFRNSILRRLVEQKLGMLDPSTILELIESDLGAIEAVLQESTGPYLYSDTPCAADAAVFGVADQYINGAPLVAPQLTQLIVTQKYPRLVRFVDEIRQKFFGEKGPRPKVKII